MINNDVNSYAKQNESQKPVWVQNSAASGQNEKSSLDEFASALPQWDLLPPAMVIRRVKRNI